MEEKEAGRRFPYFRPAGVYAPALPSSQVSFSSCASVFSSFSVLFITLCLSTRPALSSFYGKFVIEENNMDDILTIYVRMIGFLSTRYVFESKLNYVMLCAKRQ